MKLYINVSDFYDQISYMRQSNTFQFDEDVFFKGVQGIAFTMHEAMLFTKILHANPQVKNRNRY